MKKHFVFLLKVFLGLNMLTIGIISIVTLYENPLTTVLTLLLQNIKSLYTTGLFFIFGILFFPFLIAYLCRVIIFNGLKYEWLLLMNLIMIYIVSLITMLFIGLILFSDIPTH